MKKVILSLIIVCSTLQLFAKTVFYPTEFNNAPLNEWSKGGGKYETADVVVFWGALVGTDPKNYSDPNLAFDPAVVAGFVQQTFTYFIDTVKFLPNANNLGKYKIIVVMNNTYKGTGGPTGWAFGGGYDDTIGSLWIHPGATRDPYVIAHELTHSLQFQNGVDIIKAPTGGFRNYEPAGYFWETHANYMRCLEFPFLASDDFPRWLMTRQYHVGSTRHHYSTFKWLMNIQQNYGGVNTVSNLWHNSLPNETPTECWRRTSGWTQSQLNDAFYDYVKRDANYDYPAENFGSYMRTLINGYHNSAADNHWLWREYTMLSQINASTGRYIVPNFLAPQDQGFNIIPLYPTCSSNKVHIKFRGHTEVNSFAGWRWGFVEVKSNGASVYSPASSSSNGEATYTLTSSTSKLFLVVMGAPTAKHDYVWEPGWPRIYRYPYELRIENAVPEGFQNNFRADVKALYPGHTHSNGGGWVANTAKVASSVYVGPKALVLGTSNLKGKVRVDNTARLENVTASGKVNFTGDCKVYQSTLTDSAKITDAAILYFATASGNVIMKDAAWGYGVTYGGTGVVIGGDAEIPSCSTAGYYLQVPGGNNGRTLNDGKGKNDPSNVDINAAFSNFTDADMSWTAIGCNLPTANLISLNAEKGTTINTAILNWSVADQVNNNYFAIERSTNGLYFSEIGKVSASGKPSSVKQDYTSADSDMPPSGTVYYRIRQVDNDGKYSYSKTARLDFNAESAWSVAPNPAHDFTTVVFNSEATNIRISLVGANGKTIYGTKISATGAGSRVNVPLASLAKGVYILHVETNEGTKTEKIIKN